MLERADRRGRGRRSGGQLAALAGGCAAMLIYQRGLWEYGLVALVLVLVVCAVQQHRGQLIGLASIGLGAALAFMALTDALAAPCDLRSSYDPLTCAASGGPQADGYGRAAAVFVLIGIVFVALSRSPAIRLHRSGIARR